MKNLFQRQERTLSKAEKRARRLSDEALASYVDTALYTIGRNVSVWRQGGPSEALTEALTGAEALQAVVGELHRRRVLS